VPGLYAAAFILAAFLAFVVIPVSWKRHLEDEHDERRRAEERRRREHFARTTRYRYEFDPVFEGLNGLGNDLDRT
jgi:hypothetical protein